MASEFASALTRLWELAGSPKLDTVKGTSKSSLSDWKNGNVVPDKAEKLEAVVVDLRLRALKREKEGKLSPQEVGSLQQLKVAYMESLRQQAREGAALLPGSAELSRLRGLSAQAVEDAGLLMRPNSRFPHGITMAELYVPRRLERDLLDRTAEPGAQLVVGDPGFGKTTVLWSLYQQLAQRQGTVPLFVKASFLLDSLKAASGQPPTALSVNDVAAALAHCATQATPVLLLDTLDLLMHSNEGAALVAQLIDAARRQQVSVVMSCRPGEARLLPFEEEDEAEADARDAFLRPPLRLGAYNADERATAVARHSRVYCPETMHGPDASSRLEARIMGAVYQDLPLREVCDNPLTLRMLFDIYAPDPPVQDIDIASLYDQVRRQRVEQDSRAGHGDASQTDHAARDLRPVAQALARYMLAANELEVDVPLVGHHLEELLPGMRWEGIDEDLAELERRGVVSTITGTARVRFFHQTFFEYMAADWLRTVGRGHELVERLLANPTDLVLAAVAGQLVPREAPGAADRLLLPLLEDDRTVALGLELYAQLRSLGVSAEPARERLRNLPAEPVKRFLVVLPGTRHPHPERWVTDLTVVWERGEQPDADGRAVRIQLLEAVCRLLRQRPSSAVELLDDLDGIAWLLTWQPPELRSHDHLHLRLVRAAFRHDPAWTLEQTERFWRKFSEARATPALADLVRMASDETARDEDPAWAVRMRQQTVATFVRLLDESHEELLGAELDPVERALGTLWGTAMVDRPAGGYRRAVLEAITGKLDHPTRLARLYAAGLLATRLDEQGALETAEALLALEQPGAQSAALDMVIVPTFVRRKEVGTGGRSADSPFTEIIEERCREALLELPAPSYRNGQRTHPALFLEAVCRARPDDETLLRLLPDGPPQNVWLDPAGLAKLAVPAAAAGHPAARLALHTWANDPDVHAACAADKQTPAALATDFAKFVARYPTLLTYPLDEAMLSQDTGLLVIVLDLAASTQQDVLRTHDAQLRALAQHLTDGNPDRRRQGYRLCRAMVEHVGWQPPDGAALADELSNASPALATSVLELVRAAVVTGRWSHRDTEPVLRILHDLVATGDDDRARQNQAQQNLVMLARHVLATAVCRLAPVEEPGMGEQAAYGLLPFIMPVTPDDGRLVTEDIRELGRLIERLAPLHSKVAAGLLLTVSQALHAYDPRVTKPKREIANRWTVPLRVLLAHLGSGGRKDLMLNLVTQDVALARRAIEVFAQQQESSPADPPVWFRQLAHRPDLSPVLRQAVANRLRIHARTRCGGPWPELLTHHAPQPLR